MASKPTARRSATGIRTMRAVLDARKTRTPASALLELSALSYERDLLQRELDRWARRHAEITQRLADISVKETKLREIAGLTPPTATESKPKPVSGSIVVQEWSY
jgi:hypothetical protein